MASSPQSWVSEHKLASVGTVWAAAVGGSLLYTRKTSPVLKPSLKIIHARMHAQAFTLAVLSSAAALHYLEGSSVFEGGARGEVSSDAFDPICNW